MLRRHHLVSRPGCSKAPRGLFVLSWETRIFTGTSISPSPLSRQCSSRYSFRAGRNLPDKEFRYLRDRKSTRLNSSHLVISYAVFCLKKKKSCHEDLSASATDGHP